MDQACRGCRLRDELLAERGARIAELERRVRDLEAAVRGLLARLGQSATNSSRRPRPTPGGAQAGRQEEVQTPNRRAARHPPRLKQWLPPDRARETAALLAA
jgi:hypothetical protein